jgi:hypothetical protein
MIQFAGAPKAGEYGFAWVKNMGLKEFTVFHLALTGKEATKSKYSNYKKFVMRKIVFLIVFLMPVISFAQLQLGLKGGLNFANVTNASSINSSSRSGYLFGLFISPKSKGIVSSRHEIIYSKQGYNFESNSNTGNVDLDYILLPQLISINITKYFSLQVGAQMAFLINAKADSSSSSGGSGSNPYGKIMDYYNRFDYGFAGGIEIHPVLGLMIGARYNISFGNLYKDPSSISSGGSTPGFIPSVDAKNNVVQIFAGWIFGGGKSSKKK